MENRVNWVDIAKGLCIIFVVMMHSTLGVEKLTGIEGWMHYVVAFAKPFRMPDFFLLSGLFLSRVIDRPWRRYFDRKIIHFLYFYILWLTIQFVFKAPGIAADEGIRGVASTYLMAFVEPFGTLWFIYILPVFFLVTRFVRRVPVWPVFLALALLECLPIHTGFVMIDEFCGRFVYFYAGYAFAPAIFRAANWLRQRPLAGCAGLGLWAIAEYSLVFTPAPTALRAILTPEAFMAGGLGGWSELPLVSLLLGLAGAFAIVAISALLSRLAEGNPLHRALSWLGAHSIVVYLAFFLPMAVARTVLLKSGVITDIGTISLLTTVSGVIGPVFLYWAVQWTGYGHFLFRRPAWASIDRAQTTKTAAFAAE
ncbi:acyltransferase family protein [Phyllobacterium leguminum]|uniref:Putative membrane protein YcfT n=1 Tax=Phyllobacterium leguminum TaxID=314237 RepID=A0A318TJL5_9HYPH|nr:acyltransferase family protein [Phyllobacterium leguminum]PYE89360.1 putative membrane protein YcfT [Phyllobacterium leguminum]